MRLTGLSNAGRPHIQGTRVGFDLIKAGLEPACLCFLVCCHHFGGDFAVKGPQTPQGTIALLIVYAFIILALWGNVYLTMLSRGINQ